MVTNLIVTLPLSFAFYRLSDPSQYQSIVDAEWNIIYDKLDKCVKSGAKVVLSRLAIGDLATQVSFYLSLKQLISFHALDLFSYKLNISLVPNTILCVWHMLL